MGYAHIMFVREDGIRSAKRQDGYNKGYRDEVGEAVLRLCLTPRVPASAGRAGANLES